MLDANYVLRFNQTFPDGTTQHYAGTIGPYQTTSASGTPKFRGNWQNTLQYGPASITATVYYTGGYNETAEDNNSLVNADGTPQRPNCLTGVGDGTPASYRDGVTPVVCRVKSFVSWGRGRRRQPGRSGGARPSSPKSIARDW